MKSLKGRWQFIAIVALFFVPTIGAMIMVFSDWRPASFTNNGDLVQPAEAIAPEQWTPVRAASEPLAGTWLLVVPQTQACDEACFERLDLLTRLRVALDRNIDRVRLILLQPDDGPVEADSVPGGFELMETSTAGLEPFLAHGGVSMAAHIVDYRGFHVMRYAEPLDAPGLLDDLENLLKLSKEEAERRTREEAAAQ